MNLADMKLLQAKKSELTDIVQQVLNLSGEPEEYHEYHIKLALSNIDDSLESYRLMLKGLTNN